VQAAENVNLNFTTAPYDLPAGLAALGRLRHIWFVSLNFGALHVAPVFKLPIMSDDAQDVEPIALEMIERFGSSAVNIARWQAEIMAAVPNMLSAKMWWDIADASERLLSNYGQAQRLIVY
jgi:hypothetical protein